MAQFDPAKAARVWQRVQEGPKPGAEDLRPLMREVQALAAVYRRLSTQASGRNKGLLTRLYEGELANLAALKGIQSLRGGRVPKGDPLPGDNVPAGRAMELCYHRSRRLAGEYTARSVDPEFGIVFYVLADRARTQCALAAEVVGELTR